MDKKKKTAGDFNRVIYSTDPGFQLPVEETPEQETLPPAHQRLKIRLDMKYRAGKVVTLVEGYVGLSNDLEELGKKIKAFCGTGGSVKEGKIIVQGNNKDKIMHWLLKNGYAATKTM